MKKNAYSYVLSTYGRRPAIWFGVFSQAASAIVNRVFVVLLLSGMATSIAAGDTVEAKRLIVIYVAITIVTVLLSAAGELLAVRSENAEYEDQMYLYYKKLTNKDMSFYREGHTGALTALFRQFLDGGMLLNRLIRTDVVRTTISLTLPVLVLFTQEWRVGAVALSVVIIQGFYVVWSSKQANKYRELSHVLYRKVNGIVTDDITNVVAYKSAGLEKEAAEKIQQLRTQETRAFWLRRRSAIMLDFPRSIVTTLLTGLIFWFVVDSSNTNEELVGLLVLTISYIFQILRNISDLPGIMLKLDDLVTKLEPTLDVLDDDELIADPKNPLDFKPTVGAINIQDLSFSYREDSSEKKVFNKLNLTIPGGTHVGIVGLSGAGKSTLASLLLRFDEINSGKITIDGTDITQVAQSDLRKSIAYVPQEPLLFHRRVEENIAYHRPSASKKEIKRAAQAAHAAEFIDELDKGYETTVGERGVKLSGGQKQRIAIARAILKNAPILLFDEATSALDSESEQIIQRAMPEIIGKRTAIVIAHRLSTVASLDTIVVLHKGSITEQGTHSELLALKGRYYKLWQKQTKND